MARPAFQTREISGELPLHCSHTPIDHFPSDIEARFNGRSQPRTSSSLSGSSQSMSASSSSTFSSSTGSATNDAVTVVSMTPFGIPVISVGHISEDTDLEALSNELERHSGMAYADAPMRVSALGRLYWDGLRTQPKIEMESRDVVESHQGHYFEHPASKRTPGHEVGVGEARQGDIRFRRNTVVSSKPTSSSGPQTGSPPPQIAEASSSLSATSSQSMAVLVDTDNGRRKRASKARPTLAQTLSSLQILSMESRSGVPVTEGERLERESALGDPRGALSQSLLSTANFSDLPLVPNHSSTQLRSKSVPQDDNCPSCRRSTETTLPSTIDHGQHKLAEARPQVSQIGDKLSRRVSPHKEVRFLDGS